MPQKFGGPWLSGMFKSEALKFLLGALSPCVELIFHRFYSEVFWLGCVVLSCWAGYILQKRIFRFLALALSGLEGRWLFFPNSLSNVSGFEPHCLACTVCSFLHQSLWLRDGGYWRTDLGHLPSLGGSGIEPHQDQMNWGGKRLGSPKETQNAATSGRGAGQAKSKDVHCLRLLLH